MSELLAEQAQALIFLRNGLHEFVCSPNGAGTALQANDLDPRIVDVNVSGISDGLKFKTADQIFTAYEVYQDGLSRSEKEGLLGQKSRADVMRLATLLGEKIPFAELCRESIGHEPERVPESLKLQLMAAAETALADYHPSYGYDKESLLAFKEETRLAGKAAIIGGYERGMSLGRQAIAQLTELLLPAIEPEYDYYDIPFYGELKTDMDGRFAMSCNLDPDLPHSVGNNLSTTLHELGHYGQFFWWQRAIRNGLMLPVDGQVNLVSPEVIRTESAGKLMESYWQFVARDETEQKIARVQLAIDRVKSAVKHNAHIDVQNDAEVDDVLPAVMTDLPHDSEPMRRKVLEMGLQFPSLAAIIPVDWKVTELVRPIIDGLADPEASAAAVTRHRQAAARLLTTPLTPVETL